MEFSSRWLLLILCIQVYAPNVNNDTTFNNKHKQADHHRPTRRRLIGRHVCARNKVIMTAVTDVQTYCKPKYQSYLRRCTDMTSNYCTGYRVTYELAYRPAQRFVAKTETTYSCCPGWTQEKPSSKDCKKAICSKGCQNGATCAKPDQCICSRGYTGKSCEIDVNECLGKHHQCEQICVNENGTYRCLCHNTYHLQADGRSCKLYPKNIVTDAVNPFTRDIDEIKRKIHRLEEKMAEMLQLKARVDVLMKYHDFKSVPLSTGLVNTGVTRKHTETTESAEDRINSLSEQMAILEERLAECMCTSK